MGYAPREFARTLSGGFVAAGSGFDLSECGAGCWVVSVPEHALSVTVRISAAAPRRFGAFALPVLDVQLTFSPDNEKNRRIFLDRFWRYFHKGGG